MTHGHGCSQAGWPCGSFDISQALAPGSCSNQPEEGEGDSHTEILGGAERRRYIQNGLMIISYFSFLLSHQNPKVPRQLSLPILPEDPVQCHQRNAATQTAIPLPLKIKVRQRAAKVSAGNPPSLQLEWFKLPTGSSQLPFGYHCPNYK